ncbi:MAG: efflux RND transporter permease subunit [Bacteroidales bacterium]|nr:efflux RND transporter permease subunit [Bacteroidales bacterium]
MKIYEAAVKNPITTLMVFLTIAVLGLFSLSRLAIDFFPEIEFPTITIVATYPGANAETVEQLITKPIEESVSSLNGLKKVSSRSNDNISIVTVEFNYGTDLNEAANDIRNVLDRVMPLLPAGIERPSIFKFSTSQMPVLFYAVTAEKNYEGLANILEDKVVNRLNRVDGVASVMMIGAPKRVVYVDFDPLLLNNYGFTFDQVISLIKSENITIPVGTVKTDDLEYKISFEGEFSSAKDIENLVIGTQSGRIIRIKDVAVVKDTLKDVSFIERINGGKGVRLLVMKQSGTNTVKVARKVKAEMEKILPILPEDVKFKIIFDPSQNILRSISNLAETIIYALIFVSLVILFFLGRWRPTFIVLTVIPISLLSGFVYLFATGNSLNIITLSAITIAIGMVVDDAIVVLENIVKHLERGSTRREASIYGTNEVWVAVIATTVVIVVVFLPLTFLSGMIGELFRPFGWIVAITITVSTLTAISFTPMASSQLLKAKSFLNHEKKTWWDKSIKVFLDKMDLAYQRILRWVLRRKVLTLGLSFLVFILSLLLLSKIGADFMPERDQSILSAKIYLQTGQKVEKTEQTIRKLENLLRTLFPDEINAMAISAGASDEATFLSAFSSNASHIIQMLVRFKDPDQRPSKKTVFEFAEMLRKSMDSIPEIIKYDISFSTGPAGSMGSTNMISVKIFGYDLEKSMAYANDLSGKIKAMPEARDVIVSQENEKSELKVYLNQAKLSQMGLNSAMIGSMLRNYLNGITITKLKEEGKEYDIVMRLDQRVRDNFELFKNISFKSPTGTRFYLKEVAELREESAPAYIEHENKQRYVAINIKPQGTTLAELAKKVQKIIQESERPVGLDVVVGGAFQDQQESFRDIIFLMIVVTLLVYLTMAAQFESFIMPMIIIGALPFAFTGSFVALWLTGIPFSVNSLLGILMLIGIAIKNSIVLIDFINLLRDRGLNLADAIVEAGRSRLRPILMTAFTTMLGLLPLAFSTGEGSEQWVPIGVSVIGGLFFSTILSLIIVPILYYLLIRSGSRRSMKVKLQQEFAYLDQVLPKQNPNL